MTTERGRDTHVVVIGGGPAGLTAAHQLIQLDRRPTVLEKSGMVGGLARTENYKGFHLDMGGHRFFSKVDEVTKLWHEVLGEDFLARPRLSRIYYRRRFFYYPLRALNALWGLGPWQGLLIVLSYLKWQALPYRREDTFEQWVTNRFGRRLFLTFFKAYTEKVWGIPCTELKAEWAAQRIKNLSLRTVLLQMYRKPRQTIRTLIEEFHYPRLGPGMMWRAMASRIESRGGTVRLGAEVVRVRRAGSRVEGVVVAATGGDEEIRGGHYLSSMPLAELIRKLDPPAPPAVAAAADRLRYRDFLTVCLIVNRPHLFPDNWIYVHDPEVTVGRIQNFKNWSPEMVPDPAKSSLGLEYFCDEGDGLWRMADADLVALGTREVERIGLALASEVEDGCVFRVAKAYPVYDSDYRDALATVRDFVNGLENLQTIGRNGLHRYNNQDHAMLTGMLAARNLALGERNDLWSVNVDEEYHEEVRAEAAPAEEEQAVDTVLTRVFTRLDRVAFGLAVGGVGGVVLGAVTAAGALGGLVPVTAYLKLLGQYFPGYRVSAAGSLLGLVYGFAAGFAAGWLFAFARNAALAVYLAAAYRRAEKNFLRRLFDHFF
jgi:protoporphyrinogen oxidase